MMARFSRSVSLLALALLPMAAHAQIVPVPGNGTTVAPNAAGRPIVSIAPVSAGGVSRNTYSQFSVMPIGVGLDNYGVGATTIVNQVTSSNRSYINGPVEVLGSQAHVVIANPNGITISGGSFIHTGSVVLSGGTVRYDAMGTPIVPTGPGDIYVGPGGLTGTMTSLHLAAARLKIDGPIINENASPNAEISLLAGNSELTLDSEAPPQGTLRPFVTERRDLGGASDEYLIDVTPNGYMAASRVKIAVSAKGAGVAFAGTGLSTIGQFSIDASGKISTRGARIIGESGVKISGGSVEVLNSPDNQGLIKSNSGPVTILARSGNIDIHGMLLGETQDPDPDSRGAVTLAAAGDITLLSENADRLAIVYGSRGDVNIQSGGNLTNHDGRILSNANIAIKVGAVFDNSTTLVGANSAPTTTISRRGFWLSWLLGKRKRVVTTFDYGRTLIPNERALVFGSSITIDADTLINSGELSAAAGSLAINARNVSNNAVWTGTMSLTKQCGITCWVKGITDINVIGGVMNAQYGLSINASGEVINNGGQMISYGDLEINAQSVETYAAFIPTVINRPADLGTFWTGPKAWISWQPTGGYIYAPIGTLTINAATPVIKSGAIVEGGAATNIPSGTEETLPFESMGPFPPHPIGLLRDQIP